LLREGFRTFPEWKDATPGNQIVFDPDDGLTVAFDAARRTAITPRGRAPMMPDSSGYSITP
jgi:hypothetical protein